MPQLSPYVYEIFSQRLLVISQPYVQIHVVMILPPDRVSLAALGASLKAGRSVHALSSTGVHIADDKGSLRTHLSHSDLQR